MGTSPSLSGNIHTHHASLVLRHLADTEWFVSDSSRAVEPPPEAMGPPLFRSAPGEISHRWSRLKFRFQNKKGWNEMLHETFLLQRKR
ncbi:transient receptor potential cation channel subfamily V member 6-like [Arapaima gigas]